MAAPKKKGGVIKKYGLTLNLPAETPGEVVWLMADAEEDQSPFAEATFQAKAFKAILGEEQAQKVREAGLSTEKLAALLVEILVAGDTDPGK